MLGRAPAHSRRSIGGPGPTGLAGPRLWGGGPLGLRAQGPVRPGVVGCRWSLRACRHGTLRRLHCGCRRSRLRALLCPFWVEAAVVPAVVLLGVPCPGGPPDVWGPGLFRACFMPCGMGLLFPTHTINLLTRTRTWTLSELFVCTCHCFQTDKVKQDKMNLDKLYIILKV